MAKDKEKLDFLTRMRIRELVLMGLIAITAVLANLPSEYVEGTLGADYHRFDLVHGTGSKGGANLARVQSLVRRPLFGLGICL